MTGWLMRRPPAIDEELARWTLAEAPELRSLRAALRRVVMNQTPAATDPQDLAERLVIVATELAGNALRHGRPPAVVVLQRANGRLVIDVLDTGPVSGPVVDDRRPAGEGGLGLVMVGRLAEDVGWYPTDEGKRVWATFSLTGTAPL
ncbi:ATP-binding protein [Actinoplanes aureus]|uniref:ATP-binding protein n=1 Tax=Actinoplanes aureus TaxID=2792083 RepID=A0A931CCH7_9ACTN|nr:ATP-binding protein [Actinoplanes aureus]MBG0566134.1 ATP-binding protein [Actinoplanes aureus]